MTTDYVVISHEPFARYELIRRIFHTAASCDNCGSNRHNHLFQYGYCKDGIYTRPIWEDGLFCQIGCFREHYFSE